MTIAASDAAQPRLLPAGLILGLGLGGFVDGIVLHQILQWHHMLTDYGRYDTFPVLSRTELEENTTLDGVFHAATWVFCAVGLALLWRALNGFRTRIPARRFVGLLLAGWGLFNLVEGVVDHHLLTLHHVRDDVAESLPWDIGFLVLGALLVGAGALLCRAGRPDSRTVEHRLSAGAARG